MITFVGVLITGCAAFPELVSIGERDPAESAGGMPWALVAPSAAGVGLATAGLGTPDEVATGLIELGTAVELGESTEAPAELVEPADPAGGVLAIPLGDEDGSAMVVEPAAWVLVEPTETGCSVLAEFEISG